MKSHRFAFGVRSGCVRNPIGLRSETDRVAFGVGGGKWRLAEPVVGILAALSRVFVQPKLI